MYARIDRDYINGKDGDPIASRVGVTFGSKKDAEGEIIRYRLLDDDRNVYYGGASDDAGLEIVFEWAMRDAGPTILQTRDPAGKWADCIS